MHHLFQHWWKVTQSSVAYLQNLNTMVSNTSTGPVDPITVSGWPANKWYEMPHIAPLTRLSIAACVHKSHHTTHSLNTEKYVIISAAFNNITTDIELVFRGLGFNLVHWPIPQLSHANTSVWAFFDSY